MKRKDSHDIDHDLSFGSRSTKSMRLDGGDLLSIMEEDPISRVPLQLQHQQKIPLPTPTTNNDTTSTMPPSLSQDRAIVLYNPSNTPFFKAPTLPDFSIIIDSHFFPALKDYLSWPRDSWAAKLMEDKAKDNGKTREHNDCLAVVPWVAPHLPLTSGTETGIIAPLQPMEAEDVEYEMMDTDDNSVSYIGGKAFQDGEQMVEGAEAFGLWQQKQHQQQQHCLMPQFPQNMYTPVT